MGKRNKKVKDEIVITLLGGQSEFVTGSATLISVLNDDGITRTNILLELGGIQGEGNILDDYKANRDLVENIPLKSIDFCLIGHNHADHTMLLPTLSCNDKVKILMTKEQKALVKPMLLDGCYVHDKNVEYLNSKGHRVKHLYREPDFWNVYDKIETCDIGEIINLTDRISFRLTTTCHLIASTQIELFIKKRNGQVKKIVYTSDLGDPINSMNQYFVAEQKPVPKADLLFIESTYGNKQSFKKDDLIREREELFQSIIDYVSRDRKNMLIPVFSLGRLQNIMCMLYDKFKDDKGFNVPIIIDSTLGNKICDVYGQILEGEDLDYWNEVRSWGHFEYIRDYKSSIAWMQKKIPSLVLSTSGMISGGRSQLWCERILQQTGSNISFIGYCGVGTIGRQILDGKEIIEVNGHSVLRRCDIKKYNTFSGHAQKQTLLNYIKQISDNCTIVLHHGDKEAKEELKRSADEELRKKCKTNKVIISKKNMQITL